MKLPQPCCNILSNGSATEKLNILKLILVSLIFAFTTSSTQAATIHSTLIKNHQQPEGLLGISLLSNVYPARDSPYIDFRTVDGEYKKVKDDWVVTFRGNVLRKGLTILVNNKALIKPTANLGFSVPFKIKNVGYLNLTVRSDNVDLEKLAFKVELFPFQSRAEKKAAAPPPPEKKFAVKYLIGTGFTFLKYSTTNLPDISELLWSIKGGASINLGPRFRLSAGGFINAFALSGASPYQIRYLGINLRGGFELTKPSQKLHFTIYSGVYFNTSIDEYGFKDVLGPQFYPELMYELNAKSRASAYLKYSPMFSSGTIGFGKNREIAFGGSYWRLIGKYYYSLGLDISDLEINSDGLDSHAKSYSLSAGWAF